MLSTALSQNEHLLCGEGYLFELEKRGYVQVGSYIPEVVLSNPDAVKELHRELCRCGSNIIVAFTYYGHKEKLSLIGKESMLEPLNKNAIKLAKEVAKEFPNTLVAGNVSNSTIWSIDGRNSDYVEKLFDEQIQWAKDADFIIGETFNSLGEALLALKVIQKYNLESVITLSINASGKTMDEYTPLQACLILARNGATIVGLNCTRGPNTILPIMKSIKKGFDKYRVTTPLACLPVVYNTNQNALTFQQLSNKDKLYTDLESHTCTRYDMMEFGKKCKEIGIQYIGICCGGSPYHLRAIAESLGIQTIASKFSPDLSKHFAISNQNSEQSKHLFS